MRARGEVEKQVSAESKIGAVMTAYCSKCAGTRNCEIRGHHLERGGDGGYDWRNEWYLLTCRGCDHIFAQTVATNSEEYYHDENGDQEHVQTVETWPARSKRPLPEWFAYSHVDTDHGNTTALDASLKELYGALDAELTVLASIGIRTSIDIAAELLGVGSDLTFVEKLNDLVAKGHIIEAEKSNVETLIEAGNASAHRGWKPRLHDLDVLMNALEAFIYNSLVFPARKRAQEAKLAELKDKVPKRLPRAKKVEAQEVKPDQLA